jgi:predicted  nucleic acid-binding Zn-ribbon protein
MIETFTIEVHPLFIKEWELFLEQNNKYLTILEKESPDNLYVRIEQLKGTIKELEDELRDAKDEIDTLENDLYSYQDSNDSDKLQRIKDILDE